MHFYNNKRKKTNPIVFLVVMLFSFTAISSFGRMTNLIAAAGMLIFTVLTMREMQLISLGNDESKSIVAFILFFVYQAVSSLINVDSMYYYLTTTVLWTMVIFEPIFISKYINKKGGYARYRTYFVGMSIVWFFFVISSIVIFRGFDMGGRAFAQGNRGALIGGGYPLAYGSAIFAPVALAYVKEKKCAIWFRVMSLILALLSVVHVIETQSVITIAAMFAGLGLSIYLGEDKKQTRIYQKVALLLLFVFILLLFSKDIGLWLINVSDKIENPIFAQRVQEIGLYIYSDTETRHVGERMGTVFGSLKTFFENPIFGVGYKVGNTFSLLKGVGVGTHSEILDTLAKHGIVGGIPFLMIYFFQLRNLKRIISICKYLPVLTALLIMMLFNPFSSVQTSFMLFLYIPIYCLVGGCMNGSREMK